VPPEASWVVALGVQIPELVTSPERAEGSGSLRASAATVSVASAGELPVFRLHIIQSAVVLQLRQKNYLETLSRACCNSFSRASPVHLAPSKSFQPSLAHGIIIFSAGPHLSLMASWSSFALSEISMPR
jgi:hypothetical protein